MTVKQIGSSRYKENLAHAKRGPQRVPWEHPLVLVFGVHWRAYRDAHEDLAGWMKESKQFSNKVCDYWSLAKLPGETENAEFNRIVRCRLGSRNWELPAHPRHNDWQAEAGCLWIQGDCKSVADLLGAKAVLQDDYYRSMYVRMARFLVNLYSKGYRPANGDRTFVEWSPREPNTVADLAVNHTLDHGQDWEEIDQEELRRSSRSDCNYLCCVDGGRRGGGQAACGFALYAARRKQDGRYVYCSLVRVGRLLGNVGSAFLAESCSLEQAFIFLAEMLD